MTDVRSTQAAVSSVYSASTAALRTTQASVVVAYNVPAQSIRSTQVATNVVYNANNYLRASQASVLAVVKGAVDNPKLKAWTFTLDGHDFYVLKLGTNDKTLVFDLSTGQWSWWSTSTFMRWRASIGMNWYSAGSIPNDYGSNIIVGDDSYGILWVLDPEYGVDDDIFTGESAGTFPRVATGQITTKSRQYQSVFSITLRASQAQPAITANTVTLSYSDDAGTTWTSADEPIVVVASNYLQEYEWRSLGSFKSPGRLFKIEDDGSFSRIDNLDVNE